jgi:3-hydroxy acid dehydrogenase / malonic semialdehyde reductase
MLQALVTGATSGIGRAIALALHDHGHHVIAVGRNGQALDELAAAGLRVLKLDLTDASAMATAFAGLSLDVLVNNAGIMPPLGHFCDMSLADMEQTVAANLTSALVATRLLAPAMRARGMGHIFFTGSTAAHAPFPNLAVYSATKAAIGAFAQALRLDLAPSGVRVTEIVAGRVETNLYASVLDEQARAAMYAGQAAVQPQDVAAMVMAVLALPPTVDVSRFDILPTRPTTAPKPPQKET